MFVCVCVCNLEKGVFGLFVRKCVWAFENIELVSPSVLSEKREREREGLYENVERERGKACVHLLMNDLLTRRRRL